MNIYNELELKGVPLRLELGPRDIASNSTLSVRRYDNHKSSLSLINIGPTIRSYLETIQSDMLNRAQKVFDDRLKVITDWKNFVPLLEGKNALIVPWCEREECEDEIKEKSKGETEAGGAEDARAPSAGAKSLCIPHDQKRFGDFPNGKDQKCIQCPEKAERWAMFGRSY